MSDFAARERAALCDLLEELGPDSPVVPEGWRTREMAAHLVVRDRNLLAQPGLVVGPLHGITERLEAAAARRPYDELVATIRSGPPVWSPVGLPVVRGPMNFHEYVVHHEDVLRGAGRSREPSPALEDAVWARLRVTARVLFRRSPVGVELTRPDGGTITGKVRRPEVRVTGRPVEVFLFAWGRTDVADVELAGDDEAVERLRTATLGA